MARNQSVSKAKKLHNFIYKLPFEQQHMHELHEHLIMRVRASAIVWYALEQLPQLRFQPPVTRAGVAPHGAHR
jgi:hypothetical protein